MILIHNGLVRATSKEGRPVLGIKLTYDAEKLGRAVAEQKNGQAFQPSESGSTGGTSRWGTTSCGFW